MRGFISNIIQDALKTLRETTEAFRIPTSGWRLVREAPESGVFIEGERESLYSIRDLVPGEERTVTLERTRRELRPIDISKLDPTKVSEPEAYRGMFDVLPKTEQIEVDATTAEQILEGGMYERRLTIYGADLPTSIYRRRIGQGLEQPRYTFIPAGQYAPDIDVATEILRRSTLDSDVRASMAAASTPRDIKVERLINKYGLARKRPIMINTFNASERGALQRIVDMIQRGEVEALPIVVVGDPILHKEALSNAHRAGGTFVQAVDPTDAYDVMEGLVHPEQRRFISSFKRDRFGRQTIGMFTAKGDYMDILMGQGMIAGEPQTGYYLGSTLRRHFEGGYPGVYMGGGAPAVQARLPLAPTELSLGDIPVSEAFGEGVKYAH